MLKDLFKSDEYKMATVVIFSIAAVAIIGFACCTIVNVIDSNNHRDAILEKGHSPVCEKCRR